MPPDKVLIAVCRRIRGIWGLTLTEFSNSFVSQPSDAQFPLYHKFYRGRLWNIAKVHNRPAHKTDVFYQSLQVEIGGQAKWVGKALCAFIKYRER